MTDLRLAIVQTPLHWESREKNLSMLDEKLSALKDEADLIILPEMFTTGFTMNAKAVAEKMDGPSVKWMAEKATEKNCVITGSIIIEENGNYYNRLIWMRPDGTHEHYDKRHLFRMANEHEHFSPGKDRITFLLKGWKVCPLICYDLRFPVWSRNSCFGGPHNYAYDLLIYVANWPERRSHAWKTLLQARAIENLSYAAGVNRVGKDGKDIEYSGDSAVIDPKGEIISKTKAHEESIETITLSFRQLEEFRKSFPAGMDADHFEIKM